MVKSFTTNFGIKNFANKNLITHIQKTQRNIYWSKYKIEKYSSSTLKLKIANLPEDSVTVDIISTSKDHHFTIFISFHPSKNLKLQFKVTGEDGTELSSTLWNLVTL